MVKSLNSEKRAKASYWSIPFHLKMSHESDRGHQQEFRDDVSSPDSLTVESGLEALQSSPEFRGTIEPLDGLDELKTCEHIALFYNSFNERFATVAPFIRQGIKRGERVMYVIDDLPKSTILAELRGGDVDIDGALESGQLTFHSLEETYSGPVDSIPTTCSRCTPRPSRRRKRNIRDFE